MQSNTVCKPNRIKLVRNIPRGNVQYFTPCLTQFLWLGPEVCKVAIVQLSEGDGVSCNPAWAKQQLKEGTRIFHNTK